MYVKDIQKGVCAKDGEPVVLKESAATALVDGKNLLGPAVGNFCMDLAMKKAKESGVGWVVARGEWLLRGSCLQRQNNQKPVNDHDITYHTMFQSL